MPFFSVIMPVYNVEKYVEKAIESVLKQTYKDFELIIVNDGSTDSSMSTVRNLMLRNSRIKIINQRNRGLSAARNTGLRKACGEYVCFTDSDDEVDKNLLKISRDNIKKNYPDVLMFGMYLEKVGYSEEIFDSIELKMSGSEYSSKNFEEFCIDDTSLELIGYATNKLYKRILLKKNDIWFDEKIRFLEDIDFNEKVFKLMDTLKIIDDCFYHYKIRKRKSLINTFQTNHFEWQMGAIRSRKEIFEQWGSEQSKIEAAVAKLHMKAIRATCSLLFKHTNNLTFKEKYDYLYSILNDPLTIKRIKHFSAINRVDKILKVIVEKRRVYTLAVMSSMYAFHFNRLKS